MLAGLAVGRGVSRSGVLITPLKPTLSLLPVCVLEPSVSERIVPASPPAPVNAHVLPLSSALGCLRPGAGCPVASAVSDQGETQQVPSAAPFSVLSVPVTCSMLPYGFRPVLFLNSLTGLLVPSFPISSHFPSFFYPQDASLFMLLFELKPVSGHV